MYDVSNLHFCILVVLKLRVKVKTQKRISFKTDGKRIIHNLVSIKAVQ